MHMLLILTVVSICFGRIASGLDEREKQCVVKCADANGMMPDDIPGRCPSNDDLNRCIADCNSDDLTGSCNIPTKCLGSEADDNPSVAEQCSRILENKECTLAFLKYSTAYRTAYAKMRWPEADNKQTDGEISVECRNVVEAIVKYVTKDISFEQLEKIYNENNAVCFGRIASGLDEREKQCVVKCADANGMMPDDIPGRCPSNDDLNRCIADCNSDDLTGSCNIPTKCLGSEADDNPSVAEQCSRILENKECTLAFLKYSTAYRTAYAKMRWPEADNKQTDGEISVECRNVVEAIVKYVTKDISFEQLEKIYNENNAVCFGRIASGLDEREKQCVVKCADANGMMPDDIPGRCPSNDDLNRCIADCNSDDLTGSCNIPTKCLGSEADDNPSVAEQCSRILENKECTLAFLKYSTAYRTAYAKMRWPEADNKQTDGEISVECRNVVEAIVNVMCQFFRRIKFTLKCLTYNHHFSLQYVFDTVMEPLFWLIDNYVRYLGPIFVAFLMSMIVIFLLLTYLVLVPYEWERWPWWKLYWFVIGHWILVNCLFHYYMALKTRPGTPPNGYMIEQAVSICKHCISPKPPRTHHCSVCNKCILKMDHHCPWLDQCIGNYNHRYFYFTMVYLWLGCAFVVLGGVDAFVEHHWNTESETAPWCLTMNDVLFYANYFCDESTHPRRIHTLENGSDITLKYGTAAHSSLIFVYIVAVAIVVGVGALIAWHSWLISRGETSIEQHINKTSRKMAKKEASGCQKPFVNPYDFGPRQNWKIFLGLDVPGRSFFWNVVLPSAHRPTSNGLTFDSNTFIAPSYVGDYCLPV